MKNALDKLPIQVQHLLLVLVPVLLGWAGSDLVPWVKDQSPTVAYLLATVLTLATTWFTKITTEYGRGSDGVS